MEEKTREQAIENKEKPKRKKLDASTLLNILAYPTAWAAGAAYAWQYVRQESYKVIESFEVLDKQVFDKTDGTGKESFNDWVKSENAKIKIDGSSQKKQAELRRKIEVKKKDLFKLMGYKGIWHNWEIIAKNNKAEGIAFVVGGSAIALGALLIAANSKDIITSLFVHDDGSSKKKGYADSIANPMAGILPDNTKTR